MASSDQLTAGIMRDGCYTEAAAFCTAGASLGWPVAPLLRSSGSPKYKTTKESVIFNLKSLFRALTTTNTKRLVGDLRMCCRANLSPAEMNKAIRGPQAKNYILCFVHSCRHTPAVLNRIRLRGEITICFLMLVSPSTKINSNNTGRSFAAGKCAGSPGNLGIKMSLGGLPKT